MNWIATGAACGVRRAAFKVASLQCDVRSAALKVASLQCGVRRAACGVFEPRSGAPKKARGETPGKRSCHDQAPQGRRNTLMDDRFVWVRVFRRPCGAWSSLVRLPGVSPRAFFGASLRDSVDNRTVANLSTTERRTPHAARRTGAKRLSTPHPARRTAGMP